MASKIQELLLAKGEKIALVGGIVGGLGLLALTFMEFGTTIKPPEKTKAFAAKAVQIQNTINTEVDPKTSDEVVKVDTRYQELKKELNFDEIDTQPFLVSVPYFDPIAQPTNLRINPIVRGPAEFQADVFNAKIYAYDIQDRGGKLLVGTLDFRKTGNQTAPNLKNFFNALRKGRKPPPGGWQNNQGRPTSPPVAGGGFGGGSPGGPPGRGGPGGGLGGGPGGGGGLGGGEEAGFGTGGGAAPGAGRTSFEANGARMEVKYVDMDSDQDLQGKQLALSLYPQRMVILQASLPYKQELEDIRRALRLPTLNDVFSTEGAAPVYTGVDVQRRIVYPDGRVAEWTDLKYQENFVPIYQRKVMDMPEKPDLMWVMMPPSYRLTMPLPMVLNDEYPITKLPLIQQTIEKQKQLLKAPAMPVPPSRLKGEGDIFAPASSSPLAGAQNVFGGSPAGPMGGGSPFGPGMMPGMAGTGDPANPMAPGGTMTTTQNAAEVPEHVLIRVLDTDPNIRPGMVYQYRLRVRMENPNFGKQKLVGNTFDADKKELESEWAEMPDKVTIPREDWVYAVDPPLDPKTNKPAMQLKDGQAVLQIQRWQPQITIEKFREPFGDWFVTELVVNRGTYVGGRTMVNVPLWSSENNKFVLRELKESLVGKSAPKEARKGVMMDLTRSDLLVVSIDGGKTKAPGFKVTRPVEDESTFEILLLNADGSLQVRSSAKDREESSRKDRENRWKAWVEDVDKNSKAVANPMGAGGKPGAFD
jgi:hypothetical protein